MTENNNEDEKKISLLNKNEKINSPKIYGKTFPLGYQDKRKRKHSKHKKSRKSIDSNLSGSSESIEEKNEELEDDNHNINNKSNNNLDKNEINQDDLKYHSLNDDSEGEIVEEEIISEEIIAQIYKNEEILKQQNNIQENNNNIIYPIVPISENIITKEKENINEIIGKNQLKIEVKENNEKIIKKSQGLLFRYFNHKSLIGKLRIITLIIMIIYIFLMVFSIFYYIYNKNKRTIFCFEFLNPEDNYNKNQTRNETETEIVNKNENFFLLDRNAFFIVHIFLLFTFLSVINTLIRNEYLQLKHFFKEMSLYFPLTLIFNMPIILVGLSLDKYGDENEPKIWTPIFFSIFTFFGIIFMGNALINAKKHKYKSISSLINISILSSFLAAFECYCFIYCICFLVRSFFLKKGKKNFEDMSGPEIFAGIVYFGIGFLMITTFKDIYFCFIVIIIEIGLLYIRKNYSLAVVFFNIITTVFTFTSIIIAIFKYKKKVFGLAHVD